MRANLPKGRDAKQEAVKGLFMESNQRWFGCNQRSFLWLLFYCKEEELVMKLGLKKMIWVLCCIVPMMFTMSACAENEEAQEEVVIAEPRVYLDGYEVVLEDTSVTTADGKTLFLGADETYTPVAVTKEQLEERITELKKKYPDFSDSDLAALLVANASYMEPEVFTEYVETYFVDSYHLMMAGRDYQEEKFNRFQENVDSIHKYGEYNSLIKLDELYFDEYLIANAMVWERYLTDIISFPSGKMQDYDFFMCLYNYMTYRKVDDLLFMRGDLRVEGTGLIFQEYVIDVIISKYLLFHIGFEQDLILYKEDNENTFYEMMSEFFGRQDYYRMSLERLLVDEVNLVLREYADTTSEKAEQ